MGWASYYFSKCAGCISIHTLPFWVDEGATFFVTACAQQRGINYFCKRDVADSAFAATYKYNDDQRWYCSLLVLMPDHVHMLVSMAPEHELSKTVGLWKRWIWKKHGIEWQFNFFDHRLRRGQTREAKWQYIYNNPVRAGLVERPEDWPWMWTPEALQRD